MFSTYPAHFHREMGCTVNDWERWLPAALGAHEVSAQPGRIAVALDPGQLRIVWFEKEPRRIAQVRIPRLHVEFEFADVPEAQRTAFMQRFDLYLQRGGG